MREYAVALTVPAIFQGPAQHSYSKDDTSVTHWSLRFKVYKLVFDKGLALMGVALTGMVALALLVLNPFFNPGPLFFRQDRLGKNKASFSIWKFRTMIPEASGRDRSATCQLEVNRITPLGRALRKYRIDELPNFINVLTGDMSVIGPRPDSARHAAHYLTAIDHYDYRFKVKPGITGLAQIESGYAEGVEATSIKAHYDQIYVETSSGRLDVYIALRTVQVMLTGFGAR
ncbi:Sugar transferase involved in LPS biosynthesis (colanic, teichoic acid) [Tropicimonas isoalkanivorans]|uniref:Sugar transferase involved in LPS biosynthesis (Colanic, teichoic acid) n=2 Tax=Tropicimonas isoalkanivorans TaxID=441112 RepID=A0A1I1E4H2_9RHOB|nr:Sugar transferase involved in LPS biosynthesis (colanic, teichoic acid) [Tropicimonas isoalkanivorans]